MTAAYFKTENLDVGYGRQVLIHGIQICVGRGEIVSLIGPNGAGKSTILKSAARQLAPMGGSVYLDGRRMDAMSGRDIALRMAVLLTERTKPELMTCMEVVETGRYPYTGRMGILRAEDKEKAEEALQMVGGLDLASRSFLQISDGQRQKVLLARAICQEPEMILLDEPTSFLDIRHKLELADILRELAKKRNMAVLTSLHELELAQRISDRVICIRGDRIEKIGPPEEIFRSDFIRRLYGISRGSYYAELGFPEPEPKRGAPQVFVIGGGGNGIPAYRRLQREGIPFAAGILHENDLEYPTARALASVLVTETAFEPVGQAALERAKCILSGCSRILCCLDHFGTMNAGNGLLLEYGKSLGLPCEGDGEPGKTA